MSRGDDSGRMTQIDLLELDRDAYALRAGAFTLMALTAMVAAGVGELPWSTVGVLAVALGLTIVPTYLNYRQARMGRLAPGLWYLGHVTDTMAVTALVLSVWWARSPTSALLGVMPLGYFLVIFGAALRLHVPSTIFATVLAVTAYVTMGVAALPTGASTSAGVDGSLLSPAALVLRATVMLVSGAVAVVLIRRVSGLSATLQDLERKQGRILQQIRDGLLVCDTDQRVLDANAAACELLALGRTNIVGLRLSAFLPAPLAVVIAARWQELKDDGTMSSGPVRFERQDVERCVELTGLRVPLPDRPLLYVVLHDVTAACTLEAQAGHSERLQALRALSRSVAHEFNNIFATIEASSFILSEATSKQSPQYTEVEAIRSAASRAARFARDLLDMADLRPASANPVDTAALLRRAHERNRVQGEVEVRWQVGEGLWSIVGDEGQIERALGNMIAQAYRSMLDGGTLRLEADNRKLEEDDGTLAAGEYVCIRIADTGIGLPPDAVASAFDPLSDADTHAGGVGLANVQATVARHKGSVQLRSALGQGTTFTLMLPASSVRAHETTVRVGAGAGPKTGRRLLVVDDEAANRTSLARLLSLRGYDVLLADGGMSAIRMADEQAGRIDLVLLDLLMPEMNGKDVLKAIRARHPEMKVLLVTGVAEQLLVQEALELGASGVAYKPFDVPALLEQVQLLSAEGVAPS